MDEPSVEDVTSFMERMLQQWTDGLEEAPDDMKVQGVACIQSVIALLHVSDSLNRKEFDFGVNMVAKQAWLLGMIEARTGIAMKHILKEDATIGQARSMLRKLDKLIKTRGRDAY